MGGCQRASPASVTHAKTLAHAPPRIEITNASIRTWRRMRQRLDPMAMRMAISRVRSAVRAANRPPRLAQAASSTIPASTIMPPRKRRTAPPTKSPIIPGRASLNANVSSSFGFCRVMRAAIVFSSAWTWALVIPSLMRAIANTAPFSLRDSSQLTPSSDASFAMGTKTSSCMNFSVP